MLLAPKQEFDRAVRFLTVVGGLSAFLDARQTNFKV